MIEKMKVVHIVAAQTQKTELLDALRALGIVHFAEKADADQGYLERFAALSRLITVLEEQGVRETLDDDQFKVLFDELNACLERKKALEAECAAAVSACDTLAGWGSFSPAEIKELKAQGFELHFCRVDKKLLASLEADEEIRFLRLAPVGKQQTVAILGALPASCAAGEFIPPEKSLDEYRQEIADCERGLSECGAQLKAAAKPTVSAVFLSAARSSRPPRSTCPASASSCSKRRTTRTTPPCAIPRRVGTDSCG